MLMSAAGLGMSLGAPALAHTQALAPALLGSALGLPSSWHNRYDPSVDADLSALAGFKAADFATLGRALGDADPLVVASTRRAFADANSRAYAPAPGARPPVMSAEDRAAIALALVSIAEGWPADGELDFAEPEIQSSPVPVRGRETASVRAEATKPSVAALAGASADPAVPAVLAPIAEHATARVSAAAGSSAQEPLAAAAVLAVPAPAVDLKRDGARPNAAPGLHSLDLDLEALEPMASAASAATGARVERLDLDLDFDIDHEYAATHAGVARPAIDLDLGALAAGSSAGEQAAGDAAAHGGAPAVDHAANVSREGVQRAGGSSAPYDTAAVAPTTGIDLDLDLDVGLDLDLSGGAVAAHSTGSLAAPAASRASVDLGLALDLYAPAGPTARSAGSAVTPTPAHAVQAAAAPVAAPVATAPARAGAEPAPALATATAHAQAEGARPLARASDLPSNASPVEPARAIAATFAAPADASRNAAAADAPRGLDASTSVADARATSARSTVEPQAQPSRGWRGRQPVSAPDLACAGDDDETTAHIVVASHSERVLRSLEVLLAGDDASAGRFGAQPPEAFAASHAEKALMMLAGARQKGRQSSADAEVEPGARNARAPSAIAPSEVPLTPGTRRASVDAASGQTRAAAEPVSARPDRKSVLGDDVVAMGERSLDDVRGGFQTPGGLQVSFGIERAVYINDKLVTTTSLNVSDLGKVAGGAAAAGAVTSGTGNLALVQTGNGNTVINGPLSGNALGTIVQNTLDNQKIQSVTSINATVNSMQMLKSHNFVSSLRGAVIDSLRR
ncbi:hypothetical protein [Piscinibacter koreensis]|uniref:Uncharacterized protein n=1 Tax=Piscinibacter koreensis TaxID=2742824 RepID=A0A7Y6TW89_9BURK|nr:hypothetical protein [Schlegelella koreensis]NUZ05751.1 hypothetical protein [Schlegelella koreensis]